MQTETQSGGIPKTPRRRAPWGRRFMHLSGAALILMVLTHFGVMHLYYGVDRIDFSVVAMRYRAPFWRVFDMLLLAAAMTHGMYGVGTITRSYVRAGRWRTAAMGVLWTVGAGSLLLGGYVIVTFRAP